MARNRDRLVLCEECDCWVATVDGNGRLCFEVEHHGVKHVTAIPIQSMPGLAALREQGRFLRCVACGQPIAEFTRGGKLCIRATHQGHKHVTQFTIEELLLLPELMGVDLQSGE